MPSYLQRIVTSGARTAPTARPPVAIAPPMPALARSLPAIDVPADPGVAPDRFDALVNSGEIAPPATGRWYGGASVAARRDDIQRADAAAETVAPAATSGAGAHGRARAGEDAENRATAISWQVEPPADELAGPAAAPRRAGSEGEPGGGGATVIRAPRGLRPDAGVPADVLQVAAALQSAISRSPASASPPARPPRRAPAIPPSPGTAADGSDALATPRESLAATSGGVVPDGGASAGSARRGAGADVAAGSTSRTGLAPEPPAHPAPAPGSQPGAASADGPGWLLPAAPPAAVVPVAPRVYEREPRITIGRIDVEVHNEAPAAPAGPPAGRTEPSRRSARVASRFLLKP